MVNILRWLSPRKRTPPPSNSKSLPPNAPTVDAFALASAQFFLPLRLTLWGDEPDKVEARRALARLWTAGVRALNVGTQSNSQSANWAASELSSLMRDHELRGVETIPDRGALSRAFDTEALIVRWVAAEHLSLSDSSLAEAHGIGALLGSIEAIHHYLWTGEDVPTDFSETVEAQVVTVYQRIHDYQEGESLGVFEVLHLGVCNMIAGTPLQIPIEWIEARPYTIGSAGESIGGLPEGLESSLAALPNAAMCPSGVLRALRAAHWRTAIADTIESARADSASRVDETIDWASDRPLGWNEGALTALLAMRRAHSE